MPEPILEICPKWTESVRIEEIRRVERILKRALFTEVRRVAGEIP